MEWILCKNQMPCEKDGDVLIALENGEVKTGIYSEFSKTWFFGEMRGVSNELTVVAWMPFPSYQARSN